MSGQQEIPVYVRVRPLNAREKAAGGKEVWVYDDRSILSQMKGREQSKPFAVNRVFDPQSHNEELFKRCAKDIVAHALKGWSGTVFAYGQTASGKTHTMMGDDADPGIVRRSVGYIWDEIEQDSEADYIFRCTSMEVYNEKLTDLHTSKELDIVQETGKDPYLRGDEPVVVSSAAHAFEVIDAAMNNRHVGKTNMNDRSSRSHTIFRIQIDRMPKVDSKSATRSLLHLVDLAGSESMKKTGTSGAAAREGSNINQSLSALVRVIRALTEIKATKSGKIPNVYIPFRDSKLTHLLKTSLGGNTKTSIICCVTGSSDQFDQTLSTLRFAQEASKVKNDPKRGVLRDGEIPLELRKTVQAMVAAQTDEAKEAHRREVAGLLEEVERAKSERDRRLEAMESALASEREKRRAAESALYQQEQRGGGGKSGGLPTGVNRRQTMIAGSAMLGLGLGPPRAKAPPAARLSSGTINVGGATKAISSPTPPAATTRKVQFSVSFGSPPAPKADDSGDVEMAAASPVPEAVSPLFGGGAYKGVPLGATPTRLVDLPPAPCVKDAAAAYEEAAAHHKQEVEDLQEELRVRNESLAERERAYAAAREEAEELKRSLADKERALEEAKTAQPDPTVLEKAVEERTKASLAEQQAALEAELAALTKTTEEYKAQLEATHVTSQQLEQTAAERDALEARLSEYATKLAEKEKAQADIEESYVASQQRIDTLQAQLVLAAEKGLEHVQKVNEEKTQLEDQLHEERQKQLTLEMEKHRLAQELEEASNERNKMRMAANLLDTAKQEKAQLSLKLGEYEKKVQELKDMQSRLETEGAETFQRAWNAEQAKDQALSGMQEAEANRVALEAEVGQMKRDIEAAEARHASQLEQLQDEMERKELDHASKLQSMDESHGQIVAQLKQKREEELAELEAEKEHMQARYEERVATYQATMAEREQEAAQKMKELEEELQVEQDLHEKKYNEAKAELEAKQVAAEAAHLARLQEMQQRAETAEAQQLETDRHAKAMKELADAIQEAHDEKVRDVENLSRQVEEGKVEYSARVAQLEEEKEREIQRLEAERLAQIEKLKGDADEVTRQAAANKAELERQWAEAIEKEQMKYKSERSTFEAEISALHGDAARQQEAHRELETQHEQQLKAVNDTFARQQKQLAEDAEQQQRDILRQKQELEVECEKLGQITRQQKEELDCSMTGPLRDALRETEKKLSTLKAKYATAQEEIKTLNQKNKLLEADKAALKRQLETGTRGRSTLAMRPQGAAGARNPPTSARAPVKRKVDAGDDAAANPKRLKRQM